MSLLDKRTHASIVQSLTAKNLAQPPKWLPNSVAYETLMGSVAYGVSSDTSDCDIYGFCLPPKELVFPHLAGDIPGFGAQKPRFDVYQQHHINDPSALGGQGREFDVTIFSIVRFFHLAMENNPNIIDSLFTPASCVIHSTQIGERVRENRRVFLHKGAWHKFKGYAYSQLHKMEIKSPQEGSRRAELVEQHGFDCYDESQTEFLTRRGWLRFDSVTETDLLGTVEPNTGEIQFAPYLERIDKPYTGLLYTVEPYLSRCVVTADHKMLVSPMYRNIATNWSTKYCPERSDWQLRPLSELVSGRRGSKQFRSFFHIRRQGSSTQPDFPVSDDYLRLAGLYISEGAVRYSGEKVKAIALTQTENGKQDFFAAINELMNVYPLRRYEYEKETIWLLHGETARRLVNDFQAGSKNKCLPEWCFSLSKRQVEILWTHLCLGDGTQAKNGEVYYTASQQLADDIQAMMTAVGITITIRGPYSYISTYGEGITYQVFRSATAEPIHYVNFGRVLNKDGMDEKVQTSLRVGWPVKSEVVYDYRVVCFTVPNGTLITRSNGKVAIQGNSKFAYHTVRLLDEVEQILMGGDIDLQRDKERLKAIRRGEWTALQVKEFFTQKERDLEAAYQSSTLPHGPDEERIKALLLECLEAHFGSLEKAVVVPGRERELLAQIKTLCEKAGV